MTSWWRFVYDDVMRLERVGEVVCRRIIQTALVVSSFGCGGKPGASPLSASAVDEPNGGASTAKALERVEIHMTSANPTVAWRKWRHFAATHMPGADSVEIAQIAAGLLGPDVAGVVDWEAPLAVATLARSGTMVIGATLTDFDAASDALSQQDSLERVGTRLGFSLLIGEGGSFRCELWPAGLVERALLACSNQPGLDFRDYAPLLGTWIAEATRASDDLYVVLDGAMEEVRAEVRADETLTEPGAALGARAASDFFRDVASMGFGVTHTGTAVAVHVDLALPKRPLVLTRALLGDPGTTPPLDVLSRLPESAHLALLSSGFSPKQDGSDRSEALEFFRAFAAALPAEEFDPAGRDAITLSMSELVLTGGPWAFAYGADVDAVHAFLASMPPDASKAVEGFRNASRDWMLFGLANPPADFAARVERFRAIDGQYTRINGKKGSASGAPAPQSFELGPSQRSTSVTSRAPLPDGHGLPEGSLHVVETTVPNSKYVPKPGETPEVRSEVHWFVAVERDYAWIARGQKEALVVEQLRGVLAPRDAKKSVPANASKATLIGYATLPAFPVLMADENIEGLRELAATLGALRALPGDAARRLLLRGMLRDDGRGGHVLRVEMDIDETLLVAAFEHLASEDTSPPRESE